MYKWDASHTTEGMSILFWILIREIVTYIMVLIKGNEDRDDPNAE